MKNIFFVCIGLLIVAIGIAVGVTPIAEHANSSEVSVVHGFIGLAITSGLLAMARPILAHRLR